MRKTFEIPIPEDKLNQAVMAGLQEGRIRRERKKNSDHGRWKSLLAAAVIVLLLLISHFVTPDVLQKLSGGKEEIPRQRVGAEGNFDSVDQEKDILEGPTSGNTGYDENMGVTITVTDVYCCEDTFLLEMELSSEDFMENQMTGMRNILMTASGEWENGEYYESMETMLTGSLVDAYTFRGVLSLPAEYVDQIVVDDTGDGSTKLNLYVEQLRVVDSISKNSGQEWIGDWKLSIPVSLQTSRTSSYSFNVDEVSGEWTWTPLGLRGNIIGNVPENILTLFVDNSGKYLGTFQWNEEWIPVEDRDLSEIYLYLLPVTEQEKLQQLLEQTNGGQTADFAERLKEISVTAIMPISMVQAQVWDEGGIYSDLSLGIE